LASIARLAVAVVVFARSGHPSAWALEGEPPAYIRFAKFNKNLVKPNKLDKLPSWTAETIRTHRVGYPYFLQEWGFHVWNSAQKSPIRAADVEHVTPEIIAHLDANFFRVRFDRLTTLQQKYLRAMAELGPGPHKTGDIATTLGVETTTVSQVRQQLIDKGMIWSQRYGETSFTVPLFDSFMKRQMPSLEKHKPKRRRVAKNKK
jgi:hypothetical protein